MPFPTDLFTVKDLSYRDSSLRGVCTVKHRIVWSPGKRKLFLWASHLHQNHLIQPLCCKWVELFTACRKMVVSRIDKGLQLLRQGFWRIAEDCQPIQAMLEAMALPLLLAVFRPALNWSADMFHIEGSTDQDNMLKDCLTVLDAGRLNRLAGWVFGSAGMPPSYKSSAHRGHFFCSLR